MTIAGEIVISLLAGIVASAVFALALSRGRANERPRWRSAPNRWAVGCALTVASVIAVLAWLDSMATRHNIPPVLSRSEGFARLGENSPTAYYVRFRLYDPRVNPQFAFDLSQKLGADKQLFTFVASYDDLRGSKVADAAKFVGLEFSPGQRVSMALFRNSGLTVFPANVRGVLQVVGLLQSGSSIPIQSQFDLSHLSPAAKKQVDWKWNDRRSYAFASYQSSYKELCSTALRLIPADHVEEEEYARRYPVISLIGSLGPDFNPLGFAKDTELADPAYHTIWDSVCNIKSWDEATVTWGPLFGARAFLAPNTRLGDLPDAYVMDFSDPENETIPDIAAGEDSEPISGNEPARSDDVTKVPSDPQTFPPPPPTPPPPRIRRTYLVFFDWHSKDMTARAHDIVRMAAEASQHVHSKKIQVSGYTDANEAKTAAPTLSLERAQVVAADLVKNGVPADIVATQGFGAKYPLVVTGPDEHEPQNRRVEVVLDPDSRPQPASSDEE